ncbi:MAG: RNA methyltransferase [Treponema sp.]|nr:RNA methyltransferase [Treponema sp.]
MNNKQNNELAICGFAAVKELEKNQSSRIRRLYFNAEKAPLFGGLCRKLAKQKGIYNQVEDTDLQKLSGTVHHQGVVAMISPPEVLPLNEGIVQHWYDNPQPILYLDQISNANNFGAIVRSAAFFGIESIVIPINDNQANISTSTYRIAQGGMEYVHIFSVKNPEFFLNDIAGKIIRIGTDVNATDSIEKIPFFCGAKQNSENNETSKAKKTALIILGNEERGISENIKKSCDHLVTIPTAKKNLDSLNVAQAAAIICYEATKIY